MFLNSTSLSANTSITATSSGGHVHGSPLRCLAVYRHTPWHRLTLPTRGYCGFPRFSCPHMAAVTSLDSSCQKNSKGANNLVCYMWMKTLSPHRKEVHSAGWESALSQNKALWLQVCHIILYTWYIFALGDMQGVESPPLFSSPHHPSLKTSYLQMSGSFEHQSAWFAFDWFKHFEAWVHVRLTATAMFLLFLFFFYLYLCVSAQRPSSPS